MDSIKNCRNNFNMFNDFIDNFDGLWSVNQGKDLEIAREAIDFLMREVEDTPLISTSTVIFTEPIVLTSENPDVTVFLTLNERGEHEEDTT